MDDKLEVSKFMGAFPKKLFYLCESGSGTYGFRTPDSDLDLRGVFIEETVNILKLRKPRDVIDGFSKDRTVDWQIFELEKFFGLLVKSNFNILEWVFTPIKYYDGTDGMFEDIAKKSMSKRMGNHVRGWAYSIYKMDWGQPKKCLYAIRPLMCYINLMERKEFISDINKLAIRIGWRDHVDTLIDLHKRKLNASTHLIEENLKIYDKLSKLSMEIEKTSWLPDAPQSEDMVNQMLIQTRKRIWDYGE